MDWHYGIGVQTSFKKKRLLKVLSLFLLLFFAFSAGNAAAYNTCSAKVVLDADSGEVLYAENADVRMEIASTTKILTAICVIENADIFMQAIIPDVAVGVEGSSIYLRKGETWRVLDLLYGLMLRSGNDAAVALALITSGSVENFAALMNETAQKVGAANSHFTNPHGLHDDEHYSTARDMALITAYALKCPIFAAICKTKTHRYVKNGGSAPEKGVFYNKNKLLYSYEAATGVKTGYTTRSGRCLVSSASKNGKNLVCVVLNVYDTYGVSRGLFERYFARDDEQREGEIA